MSRPAKIPVLGALVERLRSDLGSDYFIEVGYWDDDLAAIGLGRPSSPDALVYVAMTGDDNLAHVECELPVQASEDEIPYQVTYRASGLEYEAVREVIRSHLRSPPATPQ